MALCFAASTALCSGGGGTSRNAEVADALRGKLILAPLTKGGHYAFRRLCAEFGAEVLYSEMAYARKISKNDKKEKALLVKAPNERVFGAQIATNNMTEAIAASLHAEQCGAQFLDLNCGCPIHEVTRRGLGSALLRKPSKLVALVERMAGACSLPVTVKIRTGLEGEADPVQVLELVNQLGDAGAAAVAIHGRTAQQRYLGNADWDLITQVAAGSRVGVIGNGDILAGYEAKFRLEQSGCLAAMTGRGALIKPWIFWEFEKDFTWNPSAAERIGVYRTLVTFMKEKFGDDDRGQSRCFDFLRLHFDFFHRYRYQPEDSMDVSWKSSPLIQRRDDVADFDSELSPTEVLLQLPVARIDLEELIGILWNSDSDKDALQRIDDMAAQLRQQFRLAAVPS